MQNIYFSIFVCLFINIYIFLAGFSDLSDSEKISFEAKSEHKQCILHNLLQAILLQQ